MAIPRFGRSKEYILVDEEGNDIPVKIKGYRASDHKLVIGLHKLSTELPQLTAKADILKDLQKKFLDQLDEDNFTPEGVEQNFISMISGLNDDDYSEEEIQDLMNTVQEIQEIEGQVTKLSYTLGQRGLKRALYANVPDLKAEYLQAQKENRLTDWIDEQEDVDVDMDHLENIANIMIELGSPKRPIGGRGKGKLKI